MNSGVTRDESLGFLLVQPIARRRLTLIAIVCDPLCSIRCTARSSTGLLDRFTAPGIALRWNIAVCQTGASIKNMWQ